MGYVILSRCGSSDIFYYKIMKYGTGALESPYDLRQYHYEPLDGAGFDWENGYDVEAKLGIKLVTKDQNGSSSCGGQAWAYYGEVLEKVATGTYEPRSARWIYSHTRSPDGAGSRGRDNASFVIKNGWVSETLVPSYDKGRAPKEPFFATKPEVTQEIKEEKEVNRSQSYLSVKPNIEIVAQAIRDNYGCVLVVNGENNGTWRTTYPKPPKVKEWGHFVYAGKVKSVKGRRFIGVKNSWGNIGEDGWQWIGEDYFDSGHVREGWTHQWDYEPAKVKVLLKQTVNLYTQLLNILKSMYEKTVA